MVSVSHCEEQVVHGAELEDKTPPSLYIFFKSISEFTLMIRSESDCDNRDKALGTYMISPHVEKCAETYPRTLAPPACCIKIGKGARISHY